MHQLHCGLHQAESAGETVEDLGTAGVFVSPAIEELLGKLIDRKVTLGAQ